MLCSVRLQACILGGLSAGPMFVVASFIPPSTCLLLRILKFDCFIASPLWHSDILYFVCDYCCKHNQYGTLTVIRWFNNVNTRSPDAHISALDTVPSPVTWYPNMPTYFPKMRPTKIPCAFIVSPILLIYRLLNFSVQSSKIAVLFSPWVHIFSW